MTHKEAVPCQSPLTPPSSEYSTSGQCLCIIFNNVNFKTLPKRSGSDKDATDIKKTFQALGFTVHVHRDCTSQDIRGHLLEMRRKNIQHNNSCFYLFFLSHGYKNGIYGVDESCFAFSELQSRLIPTFTMPTPPMEGNPKVFIFQSCRDTEGPNENTENPEPLDDHILLIFATQPNCPAYRNTTNGSHLVQCLLQVIREYPEETNIMTILTHTNRLLAQKTQYQRLRFNSSLMHDLHLPRVHRLGRELTASHEHKVSEGIQSRDLCSKVHEEQHEAAIAPRAPAFTLNSGLCMVLNNTSHHGIEAQDRLQAMMEAQGYTILSFTAIDWRNMKLLLKMTSSIACKKFVLFILSEGEKELIYDSNGKVVPIRRVLDHYTAPDSPLRDTDKFFYFETTISKGTRVEEAEEDPSRREGGQRGLIGQQRGGGWEARAGQSLSDREDFIRPPNSICCQITSESSLVPRFFRNLQRFEDVIGELIPLRDMLQHSINEGRKSALVFEEGQKPPPQEVITSRVSSNPVGVDMEVTLPCNKTQVLLGNLKLVAEIKKELNKKIKATYDKETDKETDKQTLFRLLFDEYLHIAVPDPKTLNTIKDENLKTKTKQILSNCKLEEELCQRNATIISAIKRYLPCTQELEQEMHAFESCAWWTLINFYRSMSPQENDPKKLMQVHGEYVKVLLEAVKGMEREAERLNKAERQTEMELSLISSLVSDQQPLEEGTGNA